MERNASSGKARFLTVLNVDVAIVGAGSAGLAAYHAAVKNGARAVLVEAGEHGTTCARSGCMPSKLLIAAANAAHAANHAALFGVHASGEVRGTEVLARVRRERDRFVEHVVTGVARIPPADLRRGRARFRAPLELEVEGEVVRARAIVLATGSSPTLSEPFRRLGERAVTSAQLFEWRTLPRSVVVFGCGSVGLELGQALHRLGVRVRLLGKDGKLAFLSDPQVRAKTTAALSAELALATSAEVRSVRRVDEGIEVEFADEQKLHRESFDFALIATGRAANVAALELGASGLELDSRGVPRFDPATRRCGESAVFIAGDAGGELMVQHEAVRTGTLAGENAARHPALSAPEAPSALRIAFTEPQIAAIGSSFEQLPKGAAPVVAELDFEDQGRARIEARARGYGRLYFEPGSGRLLGAELSGPSAEHLAHLLASLHQCKLRVSELLRLPFYHPVLEEALRSAFKDAQRKLEARGSADLDS